MATSSDTYQSSPLPPRGALCSCSHTGRDHHHAGTQCWANLPRTTQPDGTLGPIRICPCAMFADAP